MHIATPEHGGGELPEILFVLRPGTLELDKVSGEVANYKRFKEIVG